MNGTHGFLGVSKVAGGGYAAAVLADSPLFYYRLASTSGTSDPDVLGGTSLTLSATGITKSIAGGVTGNDAMQFDGASGSATRAVTLSPYTALTVEFWLKNPSIAALGIIFETSADFNSNNGAIVGYVDTSGKIEIAVKCAGGNYNTATITLPSGTAWHHFAIVIDRGASAVLAITPYIDGVVIAYTKSQSSDLVAFYDGSLYVAARASSALRLDSGIDEFAIYPSALSAIRIAAHYAARTSP